MSKKSHTSIEIDRSHNKIKSLIDLLKECHSSIQQGIYTEDGIDGLEGQILLDKIEQQIKVLRSHKDTTGLVEI